ncbi:MAG: DUF2017 family protein [Verrucomicrobia bacterium]|nr:DUF2017 family protein [Verrucomicrobiota bacterium]MCH8514592.1 DUF2017 domain-containing protein [Kiritimatiellia bacterium]
MAWCRRHPDGLLLHLVSNEVELLRFLTRELRRLLENGDFSQPAMHGFSPAQQRKNDPAAAAGELDEAMDEELLLYRLERVEQVSLDFMDPQKHLEEGLTLQLDIPKADTWLAWLTDLRLLLGAVLGMSPENPDPIDFEDPGEWSLEERMYVFLSELQEMMLVKMGG